VSTPANYDVIGIGNALVDVITHHDDAFLGREDLVKGSMTLIDTERAVYLHGAMGSGISMSGGSAANTMTGVASFGSRACYIGKVADDELGAEFGHDMRAVHVDFPNKRSNVGVPTGRCLIVVTPDAQRTMNTYLGVSSLLGPEDIDTRLIADGKILYMEGYLWDRPPAKEAYRKAAKAAHAADRLVSLTLSDSFCVDRHRADFRSLVTDDVDVLFGNLDELLSLYETTNFDEAVKMVRADCQLAAITLGKEGSVIISGDGIQQVSVESVERVIDTTGAGDLYASGFLVGLTSDLSLAECGRLASVAAAEVIGHVGARPAVSLARLAGLDRS
jgi:sugar/nucleoside kinase (ribokinase family)